MIVGSDQWKEKTRQRLKKILHQNIIPFWYPSTIDKEKGGFRLNHDVYGKPMGEGTKMIVTQARMVWFFSKAYNTGWGGSEFLEAAEHGYHYLRDYMWDQNNGGFFWELDSDNKPIRLNKHMYGQAFGLYALSEFAKASKNEEALSLARRLFTIFEKYSHDGTYGGYREYFLPDWSPASINDRGYLGRDFNVKRMNTHLHLLEALITFFKATQDQTARERLIEMIFVLSNSVVRMDVGACFEAYHFNWTPLHGHEHDRVSYGHNLENIWLLTEACKTVGLSGNLLLNLYKTIFSYSTKFGFDTEKGGFYDSGPLNKPADRLQKVWWVQAEALVSAVNMYSLYGEHVYLKYFNKTLNWIEKHQVDWKNGDWFNMIMPDGTPTGNKADPWKAAYHNGRAMIELLEKFRK